jgi:hypothetical protein
LYPFRGSIGSGTGFAEAMPIRRAQEVKNNMIGN